MEHLHRVGYRVSYNDKILGKLKEGKIEYKLIEESSFTSKPMLIFDIKESSPSWIFVKNWIRDNKIKTMQETFFTDQKILEADWLRLIPEYAVGYPQPEKKWREVYEHHCLCGSHGKQIKPFRIKKEPGLRNIDFMSINWAYPQFCTPEVFESFKRANISGYEEWDVIIHGKNVPSQKVKQLYVPHIGGPGLLSDEDYRVENKKETCPKCGEFLFSQHLRGIMRIKRESIESSGVDILLMHEWLGRKSFLRREILVSNKVAKIVIENQWRGVRFKVIELV